MNGFTKARSFRVRTAFTLAPLLAAAAGLFAQEVRVSPGTIEDRRTTGRFFGGLEVQLKLTGDDLADARAARVVLKKAVDETGRDLMPEKKPDGDFQKSYGSGAPDLKVSLKNPARGASSLKELSGDVELFAPSRDPAAAITVDRIVSRMDRAVDLPALRAQKIRLKVVSAKAYLADSKKRQADLQKEMQSKKAELEKEAAAAGEDPKAVEALMALVTGFAGLMDDVDENDLILQVEDEDGKIRDLEVVGKDGVIDTRGSMSSGSLRVLKFGEKLPADAKLKLLLETKKSVVRAPFSLTNVPLP